MKYSDLLVEWLCELGYTHCFFVAGGNIMHLLDSARLRFECVPVVHEVAAGIAAEYFNESAPPGKRALAIVTAGPGVTNILTALSGAWLESRELLVLAGQAKTSDLALGQVRQRGIQEIDGIAMAAPVAVLSERLDAPWNRARVSAAVELGRTNRKGPVFLELPLDVQGAPVSAEMREALSGPASGNAPVVDPRFAQTSRDAVPMVAELIRKAERPVLLLGGGVSRSTAHRVERRLAAAGVAVVTTWNGMDRVDGRAPNYFGRPNTWGMRHANVIAQQADVLVALGSRLGLQQTGFNWQAFVPAGRVVQFDLDQAELTKGHPRVDLPINGDADTALEGLLEQELGDHSEWLAFCRTVAERLPVEDPANVTGPGFIDPYRFVAQLSKAGRPDDLVVPCSSGGAFTTMMQAFVQCSGQIVITNKGLAAMGYGLSAAIGAAVAYPDRRTLLVEGDGGFTQNVQELATVDVNRLNLKIFIYSNEGYASIRMTQRNYFGGAYLGCDTQTGLGFPEYEALFAAYHIPLLRLSAAGLETQGCAPLLEPRGPAAFIVPIDPEQTFFPKISSRVTASGSMESNPLHLMSPDLANDVQDDLLRFLRAPAAMK